MPDNVALQLLPLTQLAAELGAAADQVPKLARYAIADGVKASKTHARRSTQAVLAIKAASVNRRIKTVPPRGNRLVGDVRFAEKNLPLLTSFKFTGGSPRKVRGGFTRPKLKVTVRVGQAPQVIQAGWVRPNRNIPQDDADKGNGKVSYQRAVLNGKRVGRLPYSAVRGPSVVGLMEGRPGFADDEQDFLGDEITSQFSTRVGRLLSRLEGGR